MKPTIGTVVIYNTTKEEQEQMGKKPNCNVATQLPAIVVAVLSDECVNLNVHIDGEGILMLWITSSIKGDDERQWNYCE